jgi:chromosome segregation ATPase
MARGITQDQVSAAADALVVAGDKPTVEKVRAALGTGSPNTVTRMLETWRSGLAERLQKVLQLPELPPEAGQAFTEVWRLAVTHAMSVANAALAHEQNALLAAQTSLTQERKLWEIAIAEVRAQAQSADQGREMAETRLADIQRLVEQQAGQLAELTQQRDRLQALCDRQAAEIEALRGQLEDHLAILQTERNRQEVYVRGIEDRAHAEIDRAREESKSLQAALRQKERDTSTIAVQLEAAEATARVAEHLATEHGARAKALEQQMARMDGLPVALLSAQQALQAALKRELALQAKWDRLTTSTNTQTTIKKRKSRGMAGAK